ncbi:FecCD family ABC transporter permease [Congregibacter sp.]|uniref:FecCD family ABC transporter permease n=1 Tax=Congregibacter sp. TaxID=2744308 RepID=UPI003F6AC96D
MSGGLRRVSLIPVGVCAAGLLVLACLMSITRGAMEVPVIPGLLALVDGAMGLQLSSLKNYERAVVMDLRLPRTLLAVLVGALLAQCGAVMQGLFRNPLADPGIIGVSAGAAVGAVLAIFLLPANSVWWGVPGAAFCGGFLASLLVYGLARGPAGTSVLILLLAGVAISALSGSLIGLLSYLSDDDRLRDIALWQMGSLARASDAQLLFVVAVFLGLALRFQYRAGALNALLLGESEARHMGIAVEKFKFELVVLVAAGVGIAVAASGMIGFVGLIVPHALRMLCGPDYRNLLPLSALGGAVLLLFADTIARVAIAPAELPVGIVTALLGAPFFIFLLWQVRRDYL